MQFDHGGRPEIPALEAAVVRHIVSARFQDLDVDAVDAARRTLLWATATAVAGSAADGSDGVIRFVTEPGGHEQATLIGTGLKAPAAAAAFANAVFAKAHEYEDKYWLDNAGGFAMGFAVAPAVLAAAEAAGGINGKDVLTAIAVGIDMQARLLSAIRGEISPVWTPWNSTYLFCNYGATVGVGKVLGLNEEQMLDALGLIHAQACGNFQGQMEGVLGIRMQGGFAVRNAFASVELARNGISGARQFLSGRFGFYKLHYPNHTIDYESILDGLGKNFLGRRLGFKGYPCGVVAHPVLDAVRQLSSSFALKDLESVHVEGSPTLYIMTEPPERRLNPHNGIDAQFSLPWVIACTLRDGTLKLNHFDNALVSSPDLIALAHKVTVDRQEGRESVTVEIRLKNGSRLRSQPVAFCLGHPDNPVTTETMIQVFRDHLDIAAKPIAAEAGEALIRRFVGIDGIDDVTRLFDGV
ncbi:hypothetical protein CYG48_18960 (plasmid) [Neorhizobium sp. SOG26]|uniref:MmgE/PrpD family protein n=1 Tax=Neorhizobium sp. SOG26 TaxID=2060726 RepID=UPI000E596D5C|nr:MmgE/PrpD family protein [Neorhizobium sp. SOG26]AXV17872.1 hypothetical protein CYG48_18960 [Neorhizobium sp. SOG26]